MTDSNVFMVSGENRLEAVLDTNTSPRAVVVSHPHPLYGGNMDNAVVTTIADAFFEKGFTTLRFNFRGTGNSTGRFDEGRGEQEDVRAVVAWLRENGYPQIILAGYSFGARMNAWVVSKGLDVQDHIMVSPPVGFMSFEEIKTLPSTGLIITGADDDIAPPGLIAGHIHRWGISPSYHVIDDCDHFYSGCLGKLKAVLKEYQGAMKE